jgi:very-short-patch-repair endonuclease
MQEKRILQLLGYKHNLINHQTPHEKKFFGFLLEAREIKEAARTTRSTIHRQYVFMDGRIAYIADFYLPYYKIVFEIDGLHHKHQKEYDNRRTKFLATEGVEVVRFWNYELKSPNIVEMIVDVLKNKHRAQKETSN